MGWARRHWLGIGGGLLLLEPLWRAVRSALELSGNGTFLDQRLGYPGPLGAISAVLLDPPGWSIALLIAVGMLLFYWDARHWHWAPRQVSPFARNPAMGNVRKGAIERGNVVRRDHSGAQQAIQRPTTIKYPRALRVPGANKVRAPGVNTASIGIPVPAGTFEGRALLRNDFGFDSADSGFYPTAALFEKRAVKANDIGLRSTDSLLKQDKELTRSEAALFPPATGIFRHLSNDDLRQHTVSMAQALRLLEQRFSENDNEAAGAHAPHAQHGYHPKAVELAAEILHRIGRIPIPKDNISVIGGAIVLQMGRPLGAWPFNSAANFLDFISGKLGEWKDTPRAANILQARKI